MNKDAETFQSIVKTLAEQKQSITECNEFVSFVRIRESKIVTRIAELERYYEQKYRGQCFSFFRRSSHRAQDMVQNLSQLLVKEKMDGVETARQQI